MKPRVTVYTTDSCPYCIRAKELLRQRGVPFQEIQVGWDDDAQWEALKKRSGMMSVPQIFLAEEGGKERVIGGYTELAALDRESGGLDSLK